MAAIGDRRLVGQAGGALLLANARFWPTIAPLVRAQLERWEQRAAAIEHPRLKALALEKLREERFNSEVAATLATLAPRVHRKTVVEAIVAYEVMYDYLDGLTERPSDQPLRSGLRLYEAFTDAIGLDGWPDTDYYAFQDCSDGGYLSELARSVRSSFGRLPRAAAVSGACSGAAARCGEAQTRAHAVPQLGSAQLEEWAASQAAGTSLGWREFLAGAASSVLAVHALIAAAAEDRTTHAEAAEIDTVYLSICALSTMLDSLIDHESDLQTEQAGYLRYYPSHDQLAGDLVRAARRAVQHAIPLRSGAHHVMTLVGVAAYYLSAPAAKGTFAAPVARRIRTELQPLITPTLAVMGAWRAAKRARTVLASSTAR